MAQALASGDGSAVAQAIAQASSTGGNASAVAQAFAQALGSGGNAVAVAQAIAQAYGSGDARAVAQSLAQALVQIPTQAAGEAIANGLCGCSGGDAGASAAYAAAVAQAVSTNGCNGPIKAALARESFLTFHSYHFDAHIMHCDYSQRPKPSPVLRVMEASRMPWLLLRLMLRAVPQLVMHRHSSLTSLSFLLAASLFVSNQSKTRTLQRSPCRKIFFGTSDHQRVHSNRAVFFSLSD